MMLQAIWTNVHGLMHNSKFVYFYSSKIL